MSGKNLELLAALIVGEPSVTRIVHMSWKLHIIGNFCVKYVVNFTPLFDGDISILSNSTNYDAFYVCIVDKLERKHQRTPSHLLYHSVDDKVLNRFPAHGNYSRWLLIHFLSNFSFVFFFFKRSSSG